jgi:polysaccharide pyruvyl transferase WcaK-like protein
MNNPQAFVFAGNSGYANKGCEAIVRGTTNILGTLFDKAKFYSAYFYQDGCTDAFNESDKRIIHLPIKSFNRFSAKWFYYQLTKIVSPQNIDTFNYVYLKPFINESKAVLMLGGDNYTLDYGHPDKFFSLNRYVQAQNKPVILWGASVGPFSREPEYEKFVITELKKITRIYVRESITYRYLASLGVEENVRLIADPSYFLEPGIYNLPKEIENVIAQGCIGLNLSPLLCRYSGNNLDTWINQAAEIIAFLVEALPFPLLLIPHVVSSNNNKYEDDFIFLDQVFKRLNCVNGKLHLLGNGLTAAETKWVISRLTAFVGARTHSTLAALSTGVPTISIGYSSKSRGINEDIYGHTNWVINVKDLSPNTLAERINELLNLREGIHSDLMATIPLMRNKAFLAGSDLAMIL